MRARSAKDLCAMLITRSLKDLNEEEEDIVIDYLENLGIDVDLDMTPKKMCVALLEKTMEKEIGKRIPISAYANNVLSKSVSASNKAVAATNVHKLKQARKNARELIEKKNINLPGCVLSNSNILSTGYYNIQVDPNIGIVNLGDGTSHYTAVVSLSTELYGEIFLSHKDPILELNSSKGHTGYARIIEPHDGSNDLILISPLVATILDIVSRDIAKVKLCRTLPEISSIEFTYYGNQESLDKILPVIINKLPSVVDAFSYLALGMVLNMDIDGIIVEVRVDKLEDKDDRPIFAGLVPFGQGDIPFDIKPDL